MKIKTHELMKEIIIIENFSATDARGEFTKVYNQDTFLSNEIDFIPREIFYSKSHKDVIRGMHFQLPPYEQAKLVHVMEGGVEDVIVDLRKESATYGKSITIRLSAEDNLAVYIPVGFAHGFVTIRNHTVMMYAVDKCYHSESDTGVRWDTIDKQWNIEKPIVSDRDRNFCKLCDFKSPF